jgi:hypothetical protein
MALPGLPDSWKPPVRALIEREWARLADVLDPLYAERAPNGDRTWQMVEQPERGGEWMEVWLRPVDPLDDREPVLIASYSPGWEQRELQRAQAVADEHTEPPDDL